MPQASTPESGERLARDLRRVRESRNITVEDLHDETKIPQGLIEAFEDKALFDHPQFNRVYLRSFVRTYANVIGIEADAAISALEEALSDRYTGSLVVEYLDEQPTESGPAERADDYPPGERPITEEAGSRNKSGVQDAGPRSPSGATSSPSEEDLTDAEKSRDAGEPDGIGKAPESAGAASLKGDAADGNVPEDWSVQSPPPSKNTRDVSKRTRAGGSASRLDQRRIRAGDGNQRWIVVLAAVAVLAVLVWVIIRVTDGGSSPAGDAAGVADTVVEAGAGEATDTVAQDEEATGYVQEMPALGDTMRVFVVAAIDQLEPIRVTVDDDLRRPYWVEEGDSMLFQPTERIVVEEQLDDIELRIEGIDYPTDRRDEQGRIVITRDSVRTYFASFPGQ